jgi:hypothetical protein
MIKFRQARIALTLAAAGILGCGLLQAQISDHAIELGKRIMCTCGCGDTAGTCSHPGAAFSGPCEVAKAKLKEVDERIGQGESDSAILDGFVQKYGEQILAMPPARGLNWVAWTLPGIAFSIGFALVILVIRNWRHRVALVPATQPHVSAEVLDRARREIERQTND